MPTRASKIRTINRQLNEYRKRLGEESEECIYIGKGRYRT